MRSKPQLESAPRIARAAKSGFSCGVTATVQAWAREFLQAPTLELKCRPGQPPRDFQVSAESKHLRAVRPAGLTVTLDQPRSFPLKALRDEEGRCQLMHKFWHHELQAAELMAWALLRFSAAPQEFHEGLLRILLDEVRHMSLYEQYLKRRGRAVGCYPVRDFLWQRVETCTTPLAFVALFGMGFEAANLEHAARFEARLRAAGDDEGAEIQQQIGREEVAHVRFATHWFRFFSGGLEFDRYRAELPFDLPALAVRGKQLDLEARRRAGMTDEFLTQLAAWGRV